MIERLFDELDRLCERFADEPKALEALDAVRYWAIEESVDAAPGSPRQAEEGRRAERSECPPDEAGRGRAGKAARSRSHPDADRERRDRLAEGGGLKEI